ncbi:hypothetical protein DPMN_006023 [Dreissena polymorpha]|uniref:Uncharacterized protein n=1 Tax=Dreissena polymorpha TaxID=45954 RepID=A0A9D4RXD5_DREPO|nr:hypothetical protein DPMN_006023 [Dreissena polymorpha]
MRTLTQNVLWVKKAPPPGGHMNLLTKFHEDWTINVASRVPCFQAKVTIFQLIQDIIGTNFLTNFSEDRKINVASRVLIRFYYSHISKFHEDWTINVASSVKNAPPLGSHVFQADFIIFELIQDIIGKNLLSKFHEDRKINVDSRVKNAPPPGSSQIQTRQIFTGQNTAPPTGGHVFQRTDTIFELNQHIIKTNILTNFELSLGVIGTSVLTKFHEDRTINVASRVFTRQNVDDAQRTTDKRRSQKLTMSTLC